MYLKCRLLLSNLTAAGLKSRGHDSVKPKGQRLSELWQKFTLCFELEFRLLLLPATAIPASLQGPMQVPREGPAEAGLFPNCLSPSARSHLS